MDYDIIKYVDDVTGNQYVWDKEKELFVPLDMSSQSGDNSGTPIDWDDDETKNDKDDEKDSASSSSKNDSEKDDSDDSSEKENDSENSNNTNNKGEDSIQSKGDYDPLNWDANPDIENEYEKRASEVVKDDTDAADTSDLDKFNKSAVAKELEKETSKVRAKQETDTDAALLKRSIAKFKGDFKSFIANQVASIKGDSYKRLSKKYASQKDIIMPGKGTVGHEVPLIQVYYDNSSSWREEDIKIGDECIGAIDEFVRAGEVIVEKYYFNTILSTKPLIQNGRGTGGTDGGPVMEHISQTKPVNVVIITDSDVSSCSPYYTVPGGVFFIWKQGRKSTGFKAALKGKAITKEFNLLGGRVE